MTEIHDPPLRLAIIIGSVREGRVGPVVARWFAQQAANHAAFDLDLIDLAELVVPAQPASSDPGAADLRRRIEAADAVVVVTPEYNHSFPGTLKDAIDLARREWFAKPVGFVSYGGVAGGVRAVEHLRAVFAEQHTVTVRDTVSIPRVHRAFDAAGDLVDDRRHAQAAAKVLEQLAWWGRTLRAARAADPYPA